MKLLQDKGILLRCYTQNIDSLESQAGLSSEKLIAAHGNFDSRRFRDIICLLNGKSGARCIWCKKEVDMETLMEHIEREEVMKCRHCRSVTASIERLAVSDRYVRVQGVCEARYRFLWRKLASAVLRSACLLEDRQKSEKCVTQCADVDFKKCDLLIIMGSSLVVQPFCLFVGMDISHSFKE